MVRIAITTSILLCSWCLDQLAAQYTFDIGTSITCTPVKDQQRTNTCWSFATSSFLESELRRTGAPVTDISEMYIVRQVYLDKAFNYLMRQGKANFAEGSLAHDVIRTMAEDGLVPEAVYSGRRNAAGIYDHSELIVVLKSVLDGLIEKGSPGTNWREVVGGILDIYLGPLPEQFEIGGKTYTPRSFADQTRLSQDHYVHLTSYTHHPFYKRFVLELPDNYSNGQYYNIQLDELGQTVDHALAKGYTVAWDGDISEPGFSAREGMAILPTDEKRRDRFSVPGPEQAVNAETRQLQFETYATTDDHLMHLTGIAHDQHGTKYYLVKNSWGSIGPEHGFLYMSEAYFRMKTISVTVHRDAVPLPVARHIDL